MNTNDEDDSVITITKCSDDNDDEGYKGIIYLNDDQSFDRIMGGRANSTWPYSVAEDAFDKLRLKWDFDVKLEEPEKEPKPEDAEKKSLVENVFSFFDKTKESIVQKTESPTEPEPTPEEPVTEPTPEEPTPEPTPEEPTPEPTPEEPKPETTPEEPKPEPEKKTESEDKGIFNFMFGDNQKQSTEQTSDITDKGDSTKSDVNPLLDNKNIKCKEVRIKREELKRERVKIEKEKRESKK